MLYLTNMNENEKRLQQLLFQKEMIKDFYKIYPNTYNYLNIRNLLSEINLYKRKISENVKK